MMTVSVSCRFLFPLLLALGAVHLPAAPCLALRPQETMSFSVAGKITEHRPPQLTVNTEGNMVFRVVYSDKTTIQRADRSPASARDLTVGTHIQVDGELTETGQIIAARITLKAPEKKP